MEQSNKDQEAGYDEKVEVPVNKIGNFTPPEQFEIPEDEQPYYRKFGFETPPEPIPESNIKETVTTEIVVAGSGVSGMSAALSAIEKGARVILIEKRRTCLGQGGDTGFLGTKIQKQLGVEIDQGEVVLNLMKYAANKPDMKLLKMWAEGGSETADWWIDMAKAAGHPVSLKQFPPPPDFDNATEYYPQYIATHSYEDGGPVKFMLDNAIKKGLVTYFNMRARQLIRAGKGRVTGVIAQNADGDYIKFNATKAVILCTGDYVSNTEMVAKYASHVSYIPTRGKSATGDGHQMAMWVGAVMEPGPHAPMSHGFPGPLGAGAFLQVNLLGERFHNEDVPGQSYTNAVERQPGKRAWQIFDAKYPDELPLMGIGHGKFSTMSDMVKENVEKQAIKADTIEELALKMEVPVETFKATVARYNELAHSGKDLAFFKRADRLTTIEKPPFYAGKGRYSLLAVMGGLNVNTRLQALDKDFAVIPGLYLAGNTVGNRFAVDYPTIVPGICNGMAMHFGRVAAINAVSQE